MIVTDMLQRKLTLKSTPQRIVSLVPSQTELLVYLGLEASIVGITKFCVHPSHLLKTKTVVGGTKKVYIDKIAALNPDIILCNKEENTAEMVRELEKIAPVHISDILTFQDSQNLITDYGKLFYCTEKAQKLTAAIESKREKFVTKINDLSVIYFIWRKPWMVVGGETFINSMIKLNAWKNCFENKNRYPEIDLEQLKNSNPDLILLSSEPYPFKEKHIEEVQKHTSARIILVDGEYFSWYGSRLLKAFNYFEEIQRLASSSL